MRLILLMWASAITLGSAGCARLGFMDEAPGTDVSAARDGAPGDSASDGPRATDTAAPDLRDGAPPDTKPPDAKPPDTKPTPDKGPPTTPCATGKVVLTTYGPTMISCKSMSSGFNQCGGKLFCNVSGGWHVCTASEFLVRGGKTKPSPEAAWIRGCVRNGGPVGKPQDGYCTCSSQVGVLATTSWTCGSSTPITSAAYNFVGIVTSHTCRRAGQDVPATAAFWDSRAANTFADGAVCCW